MYSEVNYKFKCDQPIREFYRVHKIVVEIYGVYLVTYCILSGALLDERFDNW